ncbi:uncharacterized protein [Drosophila tropicalis]|uniref:uncharacterized protein n=1 Tax=Drosophila tropicalis TaxID=46794 RepID=UPI0035AB9DD9
MQTVSKSSTSTDLAKELDKLESKTNSTTNSGENMPKERNVKVTANPTVRPDVKLKNETLNASSPSLSTSPSSTNTTTNSKTPKEHIISADGVASSVIGNFSNTQKDVNATRSSTTSTTVATTTTKTTTSTTTPQPKPKISYSMSVHPEWDQDQHQPLAANGVDSSASAPSSATPEPADSPVVELLRESNGNLADRGNQYIVPIVTVMLTVPLAIGVTIVMYRRFREMWSTRHYRRMDFLVDGMYND